MATTVTIPQTTIPQGQVILAQSNIAPSLSQLTMTLLMVGWPFAGDLAFTYSCQYSLDGGVTWIDICGGDVLDTPIRARGSNPANTIKIACTIPAVGQAGRKIRFAANFAKTLTISGSLSAT